MIFFGGFPEFAGAGHERPPGMGCHGRACGRRGDQELVFPWLPACDAFSDFMNARMTMASGKIPHRMNQRKTFLPLEEAMKPPIRPATSATTMKIIWYLSERHKRRKGVLGGKVDARDAALHICFALFRSGSA